MTRPTNRFVRGSGLYKCECCGRNTRSTGRGDNENVKLCAECYDLQGLENARQDGCFETEYESTARMIYASIANLGGDNSGFDIEYICKGK